MISTIYIQNYALIDQLSLSFRNGFSVITGETGAGKSILLGALGLALGKRADKTVLRDDKKKCVVEVYVKEVPFVNSLLEAHDIDVEEELILRREINASGKSRAFVNDSPVKLELLKQLGSLLVDIHSQHQNAELLDGRFQLEVLDQVAKNDRLLETYSAVYKSYVSLQQRLDELRTKEMQNQADKDYYQFLYEELETLGYAHGDSNRLDDEQVVLANAEEIKQQLGKGYYILSEDAQSVLGQLNEIENALARPADYHPQVQELHKRILSSKIELEDVAADLQALDESTEYNPARLEELNDRMAEIQRLMNKHQLQEADELLQKQQEFAEKLEGIQQEGADKSQIEKEIEELELKLKDLAKKIGDKRRKAIPALEKRIATYLHSLGMPQAMLSVELTSLDSFSAYGLEKAGFLFTANKGMPPQSLAKTASGGELSRVMLSLKAILNHRQGQPSLIFDEIDTGISGKVARQMGELLDVIAQGRQLICITHLAQIAGLGEHHYKAYKSDSGSGNQTLFQELKKEDRVPELAMMLSGSADSEAALSTANELLK